MKGTRLNGLVTGIWVVNLVICLLAAGVFLWLNPAVQGLTAPVAEAASAHATLDLTNNAPMWTPKPSITPVPPPTRRPTITPWPTPSPGPSVTPMIVPPSNRAVIGFSVEKRPLDVYRYGKGPIKKLIVAGIHGGYEHNTVELANELIAYLNDHPEHIPDDTTLYILQDLNPDGYARAKDSRGRANANNVDLNHNWPYKWQADWSRDGCFNLRILTGGSGPGSEPEVQALTEFIDKIKPAALLSYHSAALGIFPGGLPIFPPSVRLAEAIAEVSDYPYPPINTHCDYTGNLTDWASNTRQIPAIDIELTNHRDTDFDQNLRVLQAFLAWKK